jgi:hypothetical protein
MVRLKTVLLALFVLVSSAKGQNPTLWDRWLNAPTTVVEASLSTDKLISTSTARSLDQPIALITKERGVALFDALAYSWFREVESPCPASPDPSCASGLSPPAFLLA